LHVAEVDSAKRWGRQESGAEQKYYSSLPTPYSLERSNLNLVYLNGSYLRPQEAYLPISDRGLAYGDGVFTTIKVLGGVPLFLGKHLKRLTRDAYAIHLAAPVEEVEAACFGLVSRLEMEDGVIKVILTRGSGPRGLSTRNVEEPSVVVSASGLPGPRPALRAISVPDDRGPLAAHKTLNYLPNIIALRRAEEAGCGEAVFTRDGLLLEATTSNVVGEMEGSLLSPPLGGRVLGGVAREVLLEEGAIREGDLPADVSGPLYCLNSVRGIEPVVELDGRPLRSDANIRSLLARVLARWSHFR
jgi:branched-chain amino acid aminotransferase